MSSYFYKEGPGGRSKECYQKRLIYKKDISPDPADDYQPTNLTDFSFAEKRLYGRVNRVMIPIIAAGPATEMAGIRRSEDKMRPAYALSFVADAFEDLCLQFEKAIMTQAIDPNDRYLSRLAAYKGFQDPKFLYNQNLKTYQNILKKRLKEPSNAGFENFDQFIPKLMSYVEGSCRKAPLTMPAFIKSTYCPIAVSGLAIDIADEKISDDLNKIEKFKKSKNWDFFLNACQTYGFMVDDNVPWRIVADIGSPQMLDYAAEYGMESTDKALSMSYIYVNDFYFNKFKRFLTDMYNMSKQSIFKTGRCKDGSLKVFRSEPQEFSGTIDDFYALELYCKIRFIEEESHYTHSEQFQLIDDVMELARMDFGRALYGFERILNKTFDYSGSLSYINARLPEMIASMKQEEPYADPLDGEQAAENVQGGP